jgi:hypothetical protein
MGRQASRLSRDVAIHFWQNFNCASVADMLAGGHRAQLRKNAKLSGIGFSPTRRDFRLGPLRVKGGCRRQADGAAGLP